MYNSLKAAGYIEGHKRARQAAKKQLERQTEQELLAFHTLQRDFLCPSIPYHFAHDKQHYIDLDASGKLMGAIVYHEDKDPPPMKSVRSIMFISRLVKVAEQNYLPTELEIIALC